MPSEKEFYLDFRMPLREHLEKRERSRPFLLEDMDMWTIMANLFSNRTNKYGDTSV
jgi:hypothetical protein